MDRKFTHQPKKVLFLVPYPLHRAPSQRFRVELFLSVLQQANIPFKVETFLDDSTWNILYSNASSTKKALGVLKGFLKRLFVVLFIVPRYQYIFIHREASPVGPPFFEFIISKIWRKKMIFDFDDAIWIPNTSKENKIVSWFKAFWKVKFICRWSYKVVGGNDFLCAFARQYNAQVVLIPTCVDVVNHHNKIKNQRVEKVVLGWTGSHSTMKYLDEILPSLKKIIKDFDVEMVVISNRAPAFNLDNMRYVPWKEETEIFDLLQINIGLMPLEADPWCEGKCGFKLIQYMALGIPAVASPVGVNIQIIEEGKNGFLCSSQEDWYNQLSKLINEEDLRKTMGEKGREKILETYSIQANTDSFLGLFS